MIDTNLIDKLRDEAFLSRTLYRCGQIDREEARKRIMPYINTYNERVIVIAKKYNQKPRKIDFINFLRG